MTLSPRRRLVITGTDIGRILGLTPASWGTLDELAAEKREQVPPEWTPDPERRPEDDSGAMALGRDLEPWLLERWAFMAGDTLSTPGFVTRPGWPFWGGTPDAVASECVVEAKTVASWARKRWPADGATVGADDVPNPHNVAQLLWYVGACEKPRGELVVAFVPGELRDWWLRAPEHGRDQWLAWIAGNVELRCYNVERDEAALAHMCLEGLRWWLANVAPHHNETRALTAMVRAQCCPVVLR